MYLLIEQNNRDIITGKKYVANLFHILLKLLTCQFFLQKLYLFVQCDGRNFFKKILIT